MLRFEMRQSAER